jgi:hypothetical protein
MKKFLYVWYRLATSHHYWFGVPSLILAACVAFGQIENPSWDSFLYLHLPLLVGFNLLFTFIVALITKLEMKVAE